MMSTYFANFDVRDWKPICKATGGINTRKLPLHIPKEQKNKEDMKPKIRKENAMYEAS